MEDFLIENLFDKLMILELNRWVFDLSRPLSEYYRLLGEEQGYNELFIF